MNYKKKKTGLKLNESRTAILKRMASNSHVYYLYWLVVLVVVLYMVALAVLAAPFDTENFRVYIDADDCVDVGVGVGFDGDDDDD